MATYYTDPAAVGAGTGADWANAFTSLQSFFDLVALAAGDICYCRGTETLAASLDCDGVDGAINNYIQVIGCNAAGVDDGTYYLINANNAAVNGLNVDNDFYFFKNIRVINATGDGWDIQANSYNVLYNCASDNNGSRGFDGANSFGFYIRCEASGNTSHGFALYQWAAFCESIDNGASGFLLFSNQANVIGCVAHSNTNRGVYAGGGGGHGIAFSVMDENTDGIYVENGHTIMPIVGVRLTNNTSNGIEINAGGEALSVANYASGNTAAAVNGTWLFEDGNSNFAGAADGYVDQANDDFTLTDAALLRRVEIEVGRDQ